MRLSRPIKSLIGHWLPFGDIFRRLDTVDEQIQVLFDRAVNLESAINHLNEVDHRLQQAITGFRQDMADQGDFALERSIEVTQQIVGEAQSRIVADLRAEAKSQGDFALERSIEVTQQIVGEIQSQIVGEIQSQIVGEIQSQLAAIRRQVRALETAQTRDKQVEPDREGVPRSLNRSEINEPSSYARSSLISDALYAGIEDVFRGSESLITARAAEFLPLLNEIDPTAPLLDLGCGRGEWISLVNSTGRTALGVDHNSLFVDQCVTNGLDVTQGDLIEALRGQQADSLGAVTLFQVLEHLQFDQVLEILELSLQALIPGGVLIAEVPNAKNLQVGSGTFWIDPTHNRPWYPELLEFLARHTGFSAVTGRYSNPLGEMPILEGVQLNIARPIIDILERVIGPADYAVVATR